MTEQINKPRTEGKIKVHYGMKDYYRDYCKKSKNPVSYSKYSKVISDFNKLLIENILNSNFEYNIPYLNMLLSIRKDKRSPKIKNGKLYNNAPVDWKTTKTLWEADEEAYSKKILVRFLNTHTSGYVFRIHCGKFTSSIYNKKYYKFNPSREFQRSLSRRIKDDYKDKFDAFLLHKNKK